MAITTELKQRVGMYLHIALTTSAIPFFALGWPCTESQATLRSIIAVWFALSIGSLLSRQASLRCLLFRGSMPVSAMYVSYLGQNWCLGSNLFLCVCFASVCCQWIVFTFVCEGQVATQLALYCLGLVVFWNRDEQSQTLGRRLPEDETSNFTIIFFTTGAVFLGGMCAFGAIAHKPWRQKIIRCLKHFFCGSPDPSPPDPHALVVKAFRAGTCAKLNPVLCKVAVEEPDLLAFCEEDLLAFCEAAAQSIRSALGTTSTQRDTERDALELGGENAGAACCEERDIDEGEELGDMGDINLEMPRVVPEPAVIGNHCEERDVDEGEELEDMGDINLELPGVVPEPAVIGNHCEERDVDEGEELEDMGDINLELPGVVPEPAVIGNRSGSQVEQEEAGEDVANMVGPLEYSKSSSDSSFALR
eukprot:TRINITY_DN9223_c0_g1_i1.p1 TRINITY_DN9223_c0_g1~~TRINITY_DN9223_c0_g1_i1.p1  ORF type:complete len:426 (-),score=61.79 TRINITY_DN9223_c0_g1_i1:181-1437(-)